MQTNGPLQLFPLVRIAVCMAAGVAVGYVAFCAMGQWVWLGLMAVAVAGALAVRSDLWQGAFISLAAFMLGGALISHQLGQLLKPLPSGDLTYQAVVASQPQERGKVVRMDLWVVGGPLHGHRLKASLLKDSLSVDARQLTVGDGLVATSQWQQPTQFYPSHFNYPLYLRCHGFTATTLILPGDWQEAVISLRPLSYLDRTILAAKRFREATLRQYLQLGLDDEEMAVAVAMALGDRSRLTNDLRDIYSISGASHVLALSGLHLGIIYMLLSLLVGWRRLGVLRELLIIGGIWAYALFTGLSPSVVRAAVMITVFSLAGLRLGWIATHDEGLRRALLSHRDYDLISCGMFDEALATVALRNADKVLERNRGIVRENLAILDKWVESEPRISFVKPKCGTTALVYYDYDLDSVEFCTRMYHETGAFVTPGACFAEEKSMRVGYANDRETLTAGLAAVSAFLRILEQEGK